MITAAKATISKLAVARMSAQNQLAATRKTLNPQIFLQKYLEVNSTVKNRPEKLPEGRVATTDRVNGIDGMWAISSNGGAVLFTDSDPAGQFAHYAPDGKFLGKSNSSF